MEWLQQLPDSFTFGVVAGLVLGIASRFALRFLAAATVLVMALELIRSAFVL